MQRAQWIMLATVIALPLIGCSKTGADQMPGKPAAVIHAKVDMPASTTPQDGSKGNGGAALGRITLSELAAKRLLIEFAEVKGSAGRLELPYDALLYDANGGEWVFVSPSPNVFTRAAVKVEKIEGETVYYKEGPPAGTKLVTMGAVELYGVEFGVGK